METHNEFGVLKVVSRTSVPATIGPFSDADAAKTFAMRYSSLVKGDPSSTQDWPKITKCILRGGSQIAAEAHGLREFVGSITFDSKGEGKYVLRENGNKEVGIVNKVISLEKLPNPEFPETYLDVYGLSPFKFKFAVSTKAENRSGIDRWWFLGINMFDEAPVGD